MSMKDYLQRIKKIDTQIKNKHFELQQAKSVEAPVGKLLNKIAELQNEKQSIIDSIEQLPEEEYDILHLVYVQYKSLKEAAAERHISYSLCTNIHGRALVNLERIVNKKM